MVRRERQFARTVTAAMKHIADGSCPATGKPPMVFQPFLSAIVILSSRVKGLTSMNYSRLALATLAATVAYFAYGTLLWVLVPAMKAEAGKFPTLFRPHEDLNRMMPVGVAGTIGALLVVVLLFARTYPGG